MSESIAPPTAQEGDATTLTLGASTHRTHSLAALGRHRDKWWFIATLLGFAAISGSTLLSLGTRGFFLCVLLLLVVAMPWLFFLFLVRHNRSSVHGITPVRVLRCVPLTILYSVPIFIILAPAIGVTIGIDKTVDYGIRTLEEKVARTKTVEVLVWEKRAWYNPMRRILGEYRPTTKTKRADVYSIWAKSGIQALKYVLASIRLWTWAVFTFIVLRSIGYIAARVAHGVGMSIEMNIESIRSG